MNCIDRRAANFSILLLSIILPFLSGCQEMAAQPGANSGTTGSPPLLKVSDIALPAGYSRMDGRDADFARWLRQVSLKADNKVYLFDGRLKPFQGAQYAVLDIPVGKKTCNSVPMP
ncbi:DUF4846 domain-containing protein [Paraflavitalea speifideaquila]|uniref:DUF4846 domain-containing protein n=1 Tax=Paraflavitalea speifideaquila TaxID=3076558 RepID=UPI0028E35D85|nr:DUF4846 domain-containing protein [Paraflavitalea speifideiaquila]